LIFTSLDFLCFLALVFPAHWLLFSRSRRAQNGSLLVASYVFYGYWDPRFLLLMVATSLADFWFAQQMSRAAGSRRKIWLAASLTANFSVLFFFKYSLVLANALPWTSPLATWNILLPVGISFYTFQAVSYTVDVYRGRPPAGRLSEFLVYVAFFPHLVAGPIQRADELLVQFEARRRLTAQSISVGARYILWGYFKKLVVGDNCGVLVNAVFDDPSAHGAVLGLGLALFAFQIYADFSGYSDIAIGVARLFGIQLGQNFRYPYLATNPKEFWQRWHISLSTWFRDYLYIPLGGNRHHHARNIVLTFLASGLWHGANVTFLLWGAGHGLAYLLWRTRPANVSRWRTLAGGLGHFFLVTWLWVFFRAPSVPQALDYIARASQFGGTLPLAWEAEVFWCALVGIVLLMAVEWLCRQESHPAERLGRLPGVPRHIAYGTLLGTTYLLGNLQAGYDFIYFQF
jgi:D-alanyl-lipoteichoic acid acyltransferase DltB (MBOAT superfamily)